MLVVHAVFVEINLVVNYGGSPCGDAVVCSVKCIYKKM